MFYVSSRNRLRKRLTLLTAKVITHPLSEFLSSQQSDWFDNGSLAMNLLWLNPVQPGTLDGKPARDDAHHCFASSSLLEYTLVVLTKPGLDLLAHMPGGVTPNEDEDMLALRLDLFAYPLQKVRRHLADRATRHKTQMHATTVGFKHPVTGQSFGIRIVLVLAQLLQTQWLVLLAPTVQIGLAHPAPPHLILIADDPSLAQKRLADGLNAHQTLGKTLLKADVCRQSKGPDTDVFSIDVRRFVQDGMQRFTFCLIKLCLDRFWSARFLLETLDTFLLNGMDRVAHGLCRTTQILSDDFRTLFMA
jgi:hypothetical protein